MASKKGSALLMILGKEKGKGAPPEGDEEGPDYDEDLKVALSDLAAALGVSVKNADQGVEALKTIHDLCSRASE
jgi:hypothetical protein